MNGFQFEYVCALGMALLFGGVLRASASQNGLKPSSQGCFFNYCNEGKIEKIQKILVSEAIPCSEIIKLVNYSVNSFTPLIVASRGGYYDIVKVLLNAGAGIDAVTDHGFSSLHMAAQSGHVQIVTYLMNKKINLYKKTKYGKTALHLAIENGHFAVLNVLTEHCSIDVRDFHAQTALHHASKRNDFAAIKYLLSHGASVSLCDEYGQTPLYYAICHKKKEAVDLLLQNGASPYEITEDKKNILHLAIQGECEEYVLSLFKTYKCKSMMSKEDASGFTPLYYAILYKMPRVICRLLHECTYKKNKITDQKAYLLALDLQDIDLIILFEECYSIS